MLMLQSVLTITNNSLTIILISLLNPFEKYGEHLLNIIKDYVKRLRTTV